MKVQTYSFILCLAGCATVNTNSPTHDPGTWSKRESLGALRDAEPRIEFDRAAQTGAQSPSKSSRQRPEWERGQTLMQGFIGVSSYNEVSLDGGGTADVDGDDGDLDQLPLIGGGAQKKLGGERLDFGIEGFFSLEGRADAAAFAAGGGGLVVAVDVDLLIIDIYGGPFVSTFLGDKLRLYGSAGPLLEFANYHQSNATSHDTGSGFGVGGYARAGIELILPSRTMVGIGTRWSDATIDLGGGLGDLEVEGFQVMLTVSQGI